jgi:hypothetical protein
MRRRGGGGVFRTDFKQDQPIGKVNFVMVGLNKKNDVLKVSKMCLRKKVLSDTVKSYWRNVRKGKIGENNVKKFFFN